MKNLDLLWPFALCGAAMLAIAGAGIVALVRHFRSVASPAGRQRLLGDAAGWLEAQIPGLVPWEAGGLPDIGTNYRFSWRSFVAETARGSINSLGQGRPLIAFASFAAPGMLEFLAATSAHRWHIWREQGGFAIQLDGAPFGRWRAGALLDQDGRPIGEARRPATWSVNRLPLALADRWYPVTVRGRVIGEILAQSGIARALAGPAGPLVRLREGGGGADELWLLAVAILDIGQAAQRRAGPGPNP